MPGLINYDVQFTVLVCMHMHILCVYIILNIKTFWSNIQKFSSFRKQDILIIFKPIITIFRQKKSITYLVYLNNQYTLLQNKALLTVISFTNKVCLFSPQIKFTVSIYIKIRKTYMHASQAVMVIQP